MKKYFFIIITFFLSLIFFFNIVNSFVLADVAPGLPGAPGGINVNVPVINNPADANKLNEQGVEGAIQQFNNLLENQDIGCGRKNQACCSKVLLEKAKIDIKEVKVNAIIDSLINKFIQKGTDEIDKGMQNELSALVCTDGSYPRYQDPLKPNPQNCTCGDNPSSLQDLCKNIGDKNKPSAERKQCELASNTAVWTALGPIDFTLQGFVKDVLMKWGIGLAGILAMLCIIYSAFVMQTSSGNPEKIKKAKERLTACIVGLLLIIFSVFILQIIGVDILQIPGFSK